MGNWTSVLGWTWLNIGVGYAVSQLGEFYLS